MYIIVNWWAYGDAESVAIVTNENGETVTFVTKEEAQEYANTELNGYFQIVNLEP